MRYQFSLRTLMGYVTLAAAFCAIVASYRIPMQGVVTIFWLLGVGVLYRVSGPWKAGFISSAALLTFSLALMWYQYHVTGQISSMVHNRVLDVLLTVVGCFGYGYGTSMLMHGIAALGNRLEGASQNPRDDHGRKNDAH